LVIISRGLSRSWVAGLSPAWRHDGLLLNGYRHRFSLSAEII
jgi:hypothetical protein